MDYLVIVLFVRHLQGDDIRTSGTTMPGSSTRTSDGTDDTVFDATEEIADALLDPPLESTDPVEGDGHLVWFIVSLLSSAWKKNVLELHMLKVCNGFGTCPFASTVLNIGAFVGSFAAVNDLPPMSEKLLSSKAKKRLRMTRFPTRTVAKK